MASVLTPGRREGKPKGERGWHSEGGGARGVGLDVSEIHLPRSL